MSRSRASLRWCSASRCRNVLVVHPSVPAKSVKELIAHAKANPGKLTYASQGVGASGHVAAELFKLQTGTDIVHVPYKGAAPAAQDLAAGHVHLMFDVVSLALGPIQAGRVRAARRDHPGARLGPAGCADHDRAGNAGGNRRMVRFSGTRRHAARRDSLAEPRGQQGALSPGCKRPVRQPGCARCRSARRKLLQNSSRRNRTVTAR